MKKILSFLICITMLLSAVPIITGAKEVTDPVFVDFEDYKSGTVYHDKYVSLGRSSNNLAEIEGGEGKAICLVSPYPADSKAEGAEKDNYINFQSTFTKNGIFGLSYITFDSKAAFGIGAKGINPDTGKGDWAYGVSGGKFQFTGTSVKIDGKSVYTCDLGTWVNIIMAMDYADGKISVYVNGDYVGAYEMNPDVVKSTEYFNINIGRGKYSDEDNAQTERKMAKIYFDNIFAYYPPEGVTANVSGNVVDSKTVNEITVSFGQNVLADDFSAAADLNGDTVETEPVEEHGYVTGLKLKNLSLAGSTAYQITFKGITDFLGDAIDAACSFETASTDPVVSIECDDSDSVYPAGAKVNFKITSANLEGNPVVIYNNDEIVTTLLPDSEEFSVVLVGGANNIYAEVPAFDLQSEVISIEAEAYGVIGEAKFIDFEDGTTSGLQSASNGKAKHGVLKVQKSDDAHGNSLYLEFDGTIYDATVVDDRPFILVETVTGKYGTYVYEADFKFSQVETSGNFQI